MKPHAQLRTLPACKRKRRFSDEAHARAMTAVTVHEMGLAELWIYACSHCSGWHMTKFRKNGDHYRVTAEQTVIAHA